MRVLILLDNIMYFSFILGWFPANARTRWNKSIFLGVTIDHWFILEWHTFQPTLIEGSLEVKLPTIWTDGNTEVRRNIEEKKKKEDQRRERVRGKKMQVREKVQKSQFPMFFQWFVAPEGRKSRLAKAAGAEPSGQMKDEKLHAVVARSTFGSQNAHNTSCSDHFWKLRCRKSARRCGAKHISKSKVLKADGFGALLDVQMSFSVAVARDCAPCQKWAKREGFVAFPKKMAGVGHLKRICKDAFRLAGAIQETCSPGMFGSQGRFPERGCILEHQIVRCSTSYDLASLFRGRRNTLET